MPIRYRKRRILWVLTASLVLGLMARWLYGGLFDQTVWRDPEPWKHDERLRMVNDLRIRHLRGLTRPQVVELLGPSEDPAPWRPNPHERLYPTWDLVYTLGIVDLPFVIGPGNLEVLVIRFGPDGQISESRVGHEWWFR